MKIGNTATSRFLRQWHEGEKEGLDALIERHLPWLRNQIRRRLTPVLRRKGETCDFVQDAMVQFLRNGPRFIISNDADFRALILRIVENSLKDNYGWLKALRRDIARERPLPTDTVLYLDPPQGSMKTPSQSAEEHEQEAWIRLGMELLDPEGRKVLIHRKWGGLSFSDIGDHLGVSEDAARKRHDRAVKRLGDKIWLLRSGKLAKALESPST